MTRPSIVLDCDPGHDDAVAMVVAAHSADLLGITTVAGNAPLERTTHNARVMRDLLGLDVPIHAGASRPLLAEPSFGSFVHGESGLDGADLPEPTTPLDGDDAPGFIVEVVRQHPGCWLVPVGPLTNIALALRADDTLASRVAGISLMGGGTFGNRTPVAEFNIWADPEAAAIVFRSGIPLVMAGLDVTYQFQATPPRIAAVRALPGLLPAIFADLFEFFSDNYRSRHDPGSIEGAAVHDPLAVLAITRPELFTRTPRHVDVETSGEHARGMTVIDQRRLRGRAEPNCDVLTDVDAERAWAVVLDAFARFAR